MASLRCWMRRSPQARMSYYRLSLSYVVLADDFGRMIRSIGSMFLGIDFTCTHDVFSSMAHGQTDVFFLAQSTWFEDAVLVNIPNFNDI